LTQGLTSLQKKLDFFVEKRASHLCSILMICEII
jgi:hypothetical protein